MAVTISNIRHPDVCIFLFCFVDVVYYYYYSGTPPYDLPVYKTTSLLRPYSFKTNVKTIESFYYFEDPVNTTTSLLRPGFYGPTVVALTGFHCTYVVKSPFRRIIAPAIIVAVDIQSSHCSNIFCSMRVLVDAISIKTIK